VKGFGGAFLPIFERKWFSFESSKYRGETVLRIRLIDEYIERFVDARIPEDRASERGRLLELARRRVFTEAMRRVLTGIPNRVGGRRFWERAVTVAPRSRPSRSQQAVFVEYEVGKEFFDRMNFPLTRREARDCRDPHITAFGYILEAMDEHGIGRIVGDSLSHMPEIQEVMECASPSASSLSS
jgi:hypothetical protein